MTDHTVPSISAAARRETSSTTAEIAVLAALAATGTLATNILLPSLPQMAASLKVSSAAVTSSITVFLAVFALGQLAVGPISDRYGRRWPVLSGFAVFLAGSIWCGLATDLPGLLIGRVIQAAGACATSVLSRAIARDLFGRTTGADRRPALHPDRARPVLRGHRHDRVRRRHAGDPAGAAFRARPFDPGRPARGRNRQPRDPAGVALQSHLPAVPRGH